ncbi:MAG: hypothetical protein JKY09_02830 [Crocinitomicaceae bacterium]|nr:hypothetical protein [Crocinitomicaceae bacterium]
MDIDKEFKNKIDELLLTTENTEDLFNDYQFNIRSNRKEFYKEFLERTLNNEWLKFVKKSCYPVNWIETEDSVDFDVNCDYRHHFFWDTQSIKVPQHLQKFKRESEEYIEIQSHENWLKRKEKEIFSIYQIIRESGIKVPKKSNTNESVDNPKKEEFNRFKLKSSYIEKSLEDLYFELSNAEVINDLVTDQDTFVNILMNRDKISTIRIGNTLAFGMIAQNILSKMFTGLDFISLERSGRFSTPQSDNENIILLKSGNLSAAIGKVKHKKSLTKTDTHTLIEKIKSTILEIKI